MAMSPHSRFACSPSEAAERIAVVCDCWLFTPRQRRNRMKHDKSRLITTKNNIDLSGPTRRRRARRLFFHHRQEHRPAARKPHTMQHGKTLGWGSDPISKRASVLALMLFGDRRGSRAVARRCNMQDRLALSSIAGVFRPVHSAAIWNRTSS